MQITQFGLAAAERDLTIQGGATTSPRVDGLHKSPVSYLDFTSDGDRVLDYLTAVTGESLDKVGVVQEEWPIETVAALERLLGIASPDLGNEGVSLYGCPECDGLDCGVITARLDIGEDTVTWRAIAEQYEYTDEMVELGAPGLFPSIRFERHTYEAALSRELDRVRPMLEGFEYPPINELDAKDVIGAGPDCCTFLAEANRKSCLPDRLPTTDSTWTIHRAGTVSGHDRLWFRLRADPSRTVVPYETPWPWRRPMSDPNLGMQVMPSESRWTRRLASEDVEIPALRDRAQIGVAPSDGVSSQFDYLGSFEDGPALVIP